MAIPYRVLLNFVITGIGVQQSSNCTPSLPGALKAVRRHSYHQAKINGNHGIVDKVMPLMPETVITWMLASQDPPASISSVEAHVELLFCEPHLVLLRFVVLGQQDEYFREIAFQDKFCNGTSRFR